MARVKRFIREPGKVVKVQIQEYDSNVLMSSSTIYLFLTPTQEVMKMPELARNKSDPQRICIVGPCVAQPIVSPTS